MMGVPVYVWKFLFCSTFVIFSSNANAVLVTETWQAQIINTSATGGATHIFNAGDTFNWTVTYDDEGTRSHEYLDGENNIAEDGQGDDALWLTACMSSDIR